MSEIQTLTKAELAELLFEEVGLNKREAKDLVETFFDKIRDALSEGDTVKLSGFGNFQVRDKPARPGRNPKTGEIIPILPRRVVTFHASQKLKAVVEGATAVDLSDVLRYWEQEFTQLNPVKRRGNRRYYQHHEVLLIRRIRELLYEQGFTISGARNRLADGRGDMQIDPEAAVRLSAQEIQSIRGELTAISKLLSQA